MAAADNNNNNNTGGDNLNKLKPNKCLRDEQQVSSMLGVCVCVLLYKFRNKKPNSRTVHTKMQLIIEKNTTKIK